MDCNSNWSWSCNNNETLQKSREITVQILYIWWIEVRFFFHISQDLFFFFFWWAGGCKILAYTKLCNFKPTLPDCCSGLYVLLSTDIQQSLSGDEIKYTMSLHFLWKLHGNAPGIPAILLQSNLCEPMCHPFVHYGDTGTIDTMQSILLLIFGTFIVKNSNVFLLSSKALVYPPPFVQN